jgi:hypothetical protein
MIMEGLGYGIFPDVGYVKGMDSLFTIPLVHKDGSKFVRKTMFVYHHEDMDIPLIKNFVNFIKERGIKSGSPQQPGQKHLLSKETARRN